MPKANGSGTSIAGGTAVTISPSVLPFPLASALSSQLARPF